MRLASGDGIISIDTPARNANSDDPGASASSERGERALVSLQLTAAARPAAAARPSSLGDVETRGMKGEGESQKSLGLPREENVASGAAPPAEATALGDLVGVSLDASSPLSGERSSSVRASNSEPSATSRAHDSIWRACGLEPAGLWHSQHLHFSVHLTPA